jgi:hypothetical protein
VDGGYVFIGSLSHRYTGQGVLIFDNPATNLQGTVTIPFAQDFYYDGGDITIAFVNPGERVGVKTDQ